MIAADSRQVQIRRRTYVLIAGAAAVAALVWLFWWRSDERAIRRELANLAADVNAPASEGLGLMSWAAQVGTYFTDAAVIELDVGASPIEGRRTIVGVAARFHPRTREGTLAIENVTVSARDERGAADVYVTVTFTPGGGRAGEGADEREFVLLMKREGGRWRIARARAVDGQSMDRRSPDSEKSGLEK